MEKTKLLASAVLTILLLMWSAVFSAFGVTVPTFSLSSSSNQLQYVLPSGTTFNGSISTTGMVRFWVSAPNEDEAANLGIIDKTTNFSFVAQQNGTYSFNFENDLPNTIQVSFSYVTNPAISSSNDSTGISTTYMLVTAIIAVTGSVLIIFVLRRKNKTQTAALNKRKPQT